MAPKADVYAIVTDGIIEALERGVVPWRKPWRHVSGVGPTSLQTGKEYRGINTWILSLTATAKGYQSQYWATFKQAKERGGSVKKGEKGTQVVFWKPVKKDEEKEDSKSYLILRYYTVFNLDQCEGIEIENTSEPLPDIDPIESAEKIVTGFKTCPSIKHGGNRAYYSPALDYVQMPERGQFDSSERYYGTLFHELAHSTGHESRLKRDTLIASSAFGSDVYSKEELTAEFAASFLCSEAGFDPELEQSASYIASWLKVIKDDRKMLVNAASKAQKATDHILGLDN